MWSDEERGWGVEAVRRAKAGGSSDMVLAGLIEFLDRMRFEESESFARLLVTRAIIAAGRVLSESEAGRTFLEKGGREAVKRTVREAESYVLAPSDASALAYFNAAADSYPYGAGQGHYSIGGRQDCAPGSGCGSGAGSLESIAHVVGARAVLDAVVRELGPWLEGLRDPVAERR